MSILSGDRPTLKMHRNAYQNLLFTDIKIQKLFGEKLAELSPSHQQILMPLVCTIQSIFLFIYLFICSSTHITYNQTRVRAGQLVCLCCAVDFYVTLRVMHLLSYRTHRTGSCNLIIAYTILPSNPSMN